MRCKEDAPRDGMREGSFCRSSHGGNVSTKCQIFLLLLAQVGLIVEAGGLIVDAQRFLILNHFIIYGVRVDKHVVLFYNIVACATVAPATYCATEFCIIVVLS